MGLHIAGRVGGRQRRAFTAVWLMLAAISVVGCVGSTDGEQSGSSAPPSPASGRVALDEPCPDGTTLSLGAPFRGRDYAKFQATGGTVYVSVRQLSGGGTNETGQSTIYVGTLARPPTYDPHSGEVRRTIATTPVIEDTWSAIDLPEGRYWLTAANGWDVVIRSCEPGGISAGAASVAH